MEDYFGIAAFRSRQQVMNFEAILRRAGIAVRVMSTPRDVAVGCGLSVQFSVEDMAPWFAMMERRLNIARWAAAPNANNDALRKGAEKLGFEVGVMRRNVNGCWNLGYCGMGCPTNAKQSMLITTIPAALSLGATLVSRVRADWVAQ